MKPRSTRGENTYANGCCELAQARALRATPLANLGVDFFDTYGTFQGVTELDDREFNRLTYGPRHYRTLEIVLVRPQSHPLI